MTAAEKYAELEAQGLERPVCECHGETMKWSKARNRGWWVCVIKTRAHSAAWAASHRTELHVYKVRYNALNREERSKIWASWYALHREERRVYCATFRRENLERERRLSRERERRKAGWYDEGEMATKPMQAKELT